jgi:ribosome-associated protein
LEKSSENVLLQAVTEGIQEKKGKEIVQIDLSELGTAISDYFVICQGDSNTQVRALADSVEEAVWKATQQWPLHREGFENCFWVLLDYGNVIVHIFQEEYRHFYKLEDLWSDGKINHIA